MSAKKEHCQIPRCIQKILAASHCNVAYLGGSLTVGVGASNTAETSWRALFQKYLYRRFHPVYHCQVSEIMGAIGATESFAAAFTLGRNVLPNDPDLAFLEFAVNDRGYPQKELVQKGMEGIIRQLLSHKSGIDVVILGSGCRPGTDSSTESGLVDHTLHREIAEHYDLPFVDMQGYMCDRLKERGQSWDDGSIEFEQNDAVHLNDYGNHLCFEAMRECFEEQLDRYLTAGPRSKPAELPAPKVSDELQFVALVDPTRKKSGVQLEGAWERKSKELTPWYFDNVLMGRPGSKMTFQFTGPAVGLFGLVYNNGLKVEAALDGKQIAGPYLRHFIEFGKFFMLGHDLPEGEHLLELTVAPPSARHNKLQNPLAQIGGLAVAAKEQAKPADEGA